MYVKAAYDNFDNKRRYDGDDDDDDDDRKCPKSISVPAAFGTRSMYGDADAAIAGNRVLLVNLRMFKVSCGRLKGPSHIHCTLCDPALCIAARETVAQCISTVAITPVRCAARCVNATSEIHRATISSGEQRSNVLRMCERPFRRRDYPSTLSYTGQAFCIQEMFQYAAIVERRRNVGVVKRSL